MVIKIRKSGIEIEVDNVNDAVEIIKRVFLPPSPLPPKPVPVFPKIKVSKKMSYEQRIEQFKKMGFEIFDGRVAYKEGHLKVYLIHPGGSTTGVPKFIIAKYGRMLLENDIASVREELKRKFSESYAFKILRVLKILQKHGVLDKIVKDNEHKLAIIKFPETPTELLKLEREAHEDMWVR